MSSKPFPLSENRCETGQMRSIRRTADLHFPHERISPRRFNLLQQCQHQFLKSTTPFPKSTHTATKTVLSNHWKSIPSHGLLHHQDHPLQPRTWVPVSHPYCH